MFPSLRRYFGVKVGLYFAWLGFYTYMLIPASVVGLACFLYGVFTLSSHVPVREMCADRGSLLMCPLCDNGCEYWRLQDSCTQAKLSYLFDNGATVFFVVFMSVWGAAFLELWKRYSARITYQWDLSGFDTLEVGDGTPETESSSGVFCPVEYEAVLPSETLGCLTESNTRVFDRIKYTSVYH